VTATNASSLGVGGVQLVDTVPPNTTFSPSLSSPGWLCVPNTGPGSVCRNPIGNILGNASGSAIFAVTVASPLAAGVKTISNTACVSEGPAQVDDCASVSVPTVGTPILALTKSLVSGSGTPGATLVFNVAVRNTGNQGAGNVMLNETVPNYTTFLPSASDPGWVCQLGGPGATLCFRSRGSSYSGHAENSLPTATLRKSVGQPRKELAMTRLSKEPQEVVAQPQLLTPTQLVERYPAIKLRTLRYWIQRAEPRRVSAGGKRKSLQGNGLAPAIIRKGRIVLIDEPKFLHWLDQGRRG
jgi:uncharacterized repeat protein (TIGR01451 family)